MKLEINISANDIKEIHIEDVVYLYEKLNQEQQDLFLDNKTLIIDNTQDDLFRISISDYRNKEKH
ncbi:hypothetical protein ACLK4F_001517 [Campylobacter jejuni]|nr:hypothetical protein [Campylobacter jejuni]